MTQMTDAAYTKTYEESEALRQAVKDARLRGGHPRYEAGKLLRRRSRP